MNLFRAILHAMRTRKQPKAPPREFPDDFSFRCYACGTMRPNEKISVKSLDTSKVRGDFAEGTFQENFNYCNDNPECVEKARTWRGYGL